MSTTTTLSTLYRRTRRAGAAGRDLVDRALSRVGVVEAEEKIARDARDYWTTSTDDRWRGNSHWRDSGTFADADLWTEVGRGHLELLERLARVPGRSGPGWGRVVEWGCGGGANAVALAPVASSFVGVDIAAPSLEECARQVAAVTSTPFEPVLVDPADPEAAVARIGGPCDLFVCLYVLELVPSQDYGSRLLRIARDLLRPGGLAFVQVKYDTGRWNTAPRRRNYHAGLASMTTYRIEAFWELAQRCGLVPEAVSLVPRNALDERYAYFLLSRPDGGG